MTIRRTAMFVLMITLVLLCACSGGKTDEERFLEMRDDLNKATRISFTAAIRASYSEKILDYTLSVAVGSGGAEMTVLAPELISGVRATLSDGSVTVLYDGLTLNPVELGGSGVTPLAAPCVAMRALREGHIVSVTREKLDGNETLAVTALDELENTHMVWISIDTGLPVFAELQSEGRVVLSCVFTDCSVT